MGLIRPEVSPALFPVAADTTSSLEGNYCMLDNLYDGVRDGPPILTAYSMCRLR